MAFLPALLVALVAAAFFAGAQLLADGALQAAIQLVAILVMVWVGFKATGGSALP